MVNKIKLVLILILLLAGPLAASFRYLNKISFHPLNITGSELNKLIVSDIDNIKKFVLFIRKEIGNKKALVMRQGEIFTYTDLEILHIYDDRFVKLIEDAKNVEQLLKILENDKIEYIIFNHSNDPAFYQTLLWEVIYDPKLSSLVFDNKVVEVYKINLSSSPYNPYRIFQENLTFQKINSLDFLLGFMNSYHFIRNSNLVFKNVYLSHSENRKTYPFMNPKIGFDSDFSKEPGLVGYELFFDADIVSNDNCKLVINLFQFDNYNNNISLNLDQDVILHKGNNRVRTRILYNNINPFRFVMHDSCNTPIIVENASLKWRYKPFSEGYFNKGVIVDLNDAILGLINDEVSIKTYTKTKFRFHNIDEKNGMLSFQAKGNADINIYEKQRNILGMERGVLIGAYGLQNENNPINVKFKNLQSVYLELVPNKKVNKLEDESYIVMSNFEITKEE